MVDDPKLWHWNNIDSGEIELEIDYFRSEAMEKLRVARSGAARAGASSK